MGAEKLNRVSFANLKQLVKTLTAASFRIALEAFNTLAVANVVNWITGSSKSIRSARVSNTWICTSQIAQLAISCRWTIRIDSAIRD